MKYYVLYNPFSANGRGEQLTFALTKILLGEDLEYVNLTKVKDVKAYIKGLDDDDKIILSGGDGTLNRFINDTDGYKIKNELYFYGTGSGNDFLNDLGKRKDNKPVLINSYIKDLPTVTINGKTSKFINGIGFGIDGYCCEEGDRIRMKSKKHVNYTLIALKGMFFGYKPVKATVTVDGKKYEFSRVWLSPTMNGRFFGGGMMITPNQNRLNKERTVTLAVAHNLSKFNIIRLFPKIFKGTHTECVKYVSFFEGHDIKVEFNRPNALQIDGETVLNVVSYEVHTNTKNETYQAIASGVKSTLKKAKEKLTQTADKVKSKI